MGGWGRESRGRKKPLPLQLGIAQLKVTTWGTKLKGQRMGGKQGVVGIVRKSKALGKGKAIILCGMTGGG